MDRLFALKKYVKYRLSAGTAHDVHSPFVFDLLNDVISDETPFYGFDLLESLRSQLLLDRKTIKVTDFGTGENQREERICVIAKKSLKSVKYAQLLFRLVNKFNPENILEIGTSLGLTTLYLSLPQKKNTVITLEGCPGIAEIAQKNFNRLKRANIELLTGEFSQTLPLAIRKLPRLEFVFFDGNHQKKPTLDYFNQCLQNATENSLFIFDDIHWSSEMDEAWEKIKTNEKVSLTIDLYQLGLVFFRKGIVKQHFTLKY